MKEIKIKIKTKIIARVYPVSWSDNKVLKYRAHIECLNGVKIYGDPKSTKESAIASCASEVGRYRRAAEAFATQTLNWQEI